ncbi:hypothetical protein Dimus_005512 [Dionaea muscipula]
MGAGRKKVTLMLKEKTPPQWTQNCSASARNLRKSELGGVIFGCKHSTFKECILKQLFGLPASHFAYVKNVTANMPLFLFNYSDRKLYGIFEAAGPGQMNIDTYAWTLNVSGSTLYPAQVRVKLRIQCQPLSEDQFKPIIAGNYFERTFFWFELDRAQTHQLISLFSQFPVNQSASPQSTTRWGTLFARAFPSVQNQGGESEVPSDANSGHLSASGVSGGFSSEVAFEKENENLETSPVHRDQENQASVVVPFRQKTWSSLFSGACASVSSQDPETRVDANSAHMSASNRSWGLSSDVVPCHKENQKAETSTDDNEQENHESVGIPIPQKTRSSLFKLPSDSIVKWEGESSGILASGENILSPTQADGPDEAEDSMTMVLKHDSSHESNMEYHPSCIISNPCGENMLLKVPLDEIAMEKQEDRCISKPSSVSSYTASFGESIAEEDCAQIPIIIATEPKAEQEEIISEMRSSDLQWVVVQLNESIVEMKSCNLEQNRRIHDLEQELAQHKEEIQKLQTKFRKFESGIFLSTGSVKGEESEKSLIQLEDSILIVGGYNGLSWLSALDSYSPSQDLLKCLQPMPFLRSYASAAKLNSELYVFGGSDGTGTLWYDTVESYDQTNDRWVSRPSLNRKKGSLTGASLTGKIFAIGGGDGKECFSEVEMLDPNIGKWITTRSMLEQRFAPSSAEINGVLYVVGGYDGLQYLNSMERFDPREHSWTRVANMSTRRACHSVTVLNEKLYAIGGFDGVAMSSTVEVFDPRIGSWMMAQPMNEPRGYMGAVTIGNSVYVICGAQNSDQVSNTVECYTEDHGWEVTGLKSIGKRCFFSAIVA